MPRNESIWTAEETAILTQHYEGLGKVGIMESGLLPGRSGASIKSKVQSMGLTLAAPSKRKAKPFRWPVPAQNFPDEHRHWQETYIPPQPRCEFRALGVGL